MSNNMADLWGDEAFELTSMIAAINEIDSIPGRAGDLVFAKAGVENPISTTTVAIESVAQELRLIQTTARGAPAEKELADKRKLFNLTVPHIQLEDTILADSVQNVREFGSTNQLRTVQSVVNRQLTKIAHRLDYTLEFHRLGALKGLIRDADGSVLTDLYEAFGFLNSLGVAGPEVFNFDLLNVAADAEDIRIKCQDVHRYMKRHVKTVIPGTAKVWAFCGDDFFDALISNPSVKRAWNGMQSAEERLGGNYAYGVFEFGGIFFENYAGSDDNSEISIATDEARFFFVGVDGLYQESYAPADYIETVNTPGLPRYAKLAPDLKFNRSAEIEAQTNPLPLCLRPATLCKGVMTE
jgi:hypothetical protein